MEDLRLSLAGFLVLHQLEGLGFSESVLADAVRDELYMICESLPMEEKNRVREFLESLNLAMGDNYDELLIC